MLWGLQDTAGILTNRVLRTRYVSRLDRDASDAICCSSARTTSGTDWIAIGGRGRKRDQVETMSELTLLATGGMCKSRMFVVYIGCVYMPSIMDICVVCVTVKSRMTCG